MSNMPPPPPGGAPPPPPGGGAPPPPPGAGTPPPIGSYGQAATGMPPKANFGKRLGAVIIDGLITGAMTIPAYIALFAGPTEIEPCNSDTFAPGTLCEVPTGGTWAIFAVLLIAAFAGGLAYWGIMEGKGQTVGKKTLGIRTADLNTGQPIGTGKAIGRYFAKILSGIPCFLGYLWMLWDDQSQTWHDKIVSTVVVDA